MIEVWDLVAGALSFTLALAWNTAVSKAVDTYVPFDKNGGAVQASFLYALSVTVLIVIFVAIVDSTRQTFYRAQGRRPPPRTVLGSPFEPRQAKKKALVGLWQPDD